MPNDSSSGFTLSRNTDPRTIITPDAFTVDESLFGTPLAAPWRRFVAICLDFVLAAFIANVGGALVGFVVAILFFRLATRRRVDKVLRRWLRTTLAFLGAFALFVTAVSVLGDDDEDDGGLPFFVSGVMSVEDDVPDPSAQGTQQTPADSVLTLLREHNVDVRTFQDAVGMPAVALDVLASETTLDDLSPDERAAAVTALRRYADALAAADEAALDTLQSEAVAVTAGDRLRALRERIDTMDDENDELEDTNEALREQLEEPSFAYLITGLGNDLGLTFGWIGIYFTLFLAWWKGQTPRQVPDGHPRGTAQWRAAFALVCDGALRWICSGRGDGLPGLPADLLGPEPPGNSRPHRPDGRHSNGSRNAGQGSAPRFGSHVVGCGCERGRPSVCRQWHRFCNG